MSFTNTDDNSESCRCCRYLISNEDNWFLPPSPPPLTTTNTAIADTAVNNDSATKGVVEVSVDDEITCIHLLTAYQRIQQVSITTNDAIRLVDTHTHAHLERMEIETNINNEIDHNNGTNNNSKKESNHIYSIKSAIANGQLTHDVTDDDGGQMVVLSCAVDMDDWDRCLAYAAQSQYRIPALGIHPWYVDSVVSTTTKTTSTAGNDLHNTPTTWWLDLLEGRLQRHPGCMVGEIGLCKVARFLRTYHGGKSAALTLQRDVFVQQLFLAAKYRRPVSIHCVNQHGTLLQVFQSLITDQIPPAMALHSYTGTVHHVQKLLQWEQHVREHERSASTDPILYFGVSHSVNYVMCTSEKSKRQGIETLRSIPRHRILIESDVHCSDHVAFGAAGTVAYLAHVLQDSVENVAAWTTQNGLRFLSTILLDPNH